MCRILRLAGWMTLATAVAAGVAAPASACGTGKLLFEEKFAAMPAWIGATPEKTVGPNGLTITENLANTVWFQGPPDPYANVEVCAIVSAQASAGESAAAGLGVYSFNAENYYRVAISNISGEFSIERRMTGQWITLAPFASTPVIRTGPTAENELSIKMSGNHALVSINDKPVGEFDAAVTFVNEKHQNYLNIVWVSYAGEKIANTYVFKDLQVRELQ